MLAVHNKHVSAGEKISVSPSSCNTLTKMSVRRASVSSQVFVANKIDATVAEAGSNGSSGQEQQHPLPRSKFARVYRSTLFNVIIAGLISFTQPGIWNALNSQSTAMSAQSSYVMETDSNFVRHWRGRSTRTLPCERGKLVDIRTYGTGMFDLQYPG